MRCRSLIGLVCLMLLAQSSRADELLFKNGDRLTGKIAHLVDGKLVFKSDIAGEVTVKLSDIRTLGSDDPIEVNLKDNTGFKQKILSAEAGRFGVEGSDALKAQEFAVDDIVSINPPIPKWTG
ncbi:MAG: hypothetical protein ACYSW0_20675, partial [Planctomycetota bacterium]